MFKDSKCSRHILTDKKYFYKSKLEILEPYGRVIKVIQWQKKQAVDKNLKHIIRLLYYGYG